MTYHNLFGSELIWIFSVKNLNIKSNNWFWAVTINQHKHVGLDLKWIPHLFFDARRNIKEEHIDSKRVKF